MQKIECPRGFVVQKEGYDSTQSVCSHSEGGLKRAYGLCQRMMHFFHQYLLYVTFEVLEPHWLTLLRQLNAAETLDKVLLIPHLIFHLFGSRVTRSVLLQTFLLPSSIFQACQPLQDRLVKISCLQPAVYIELTTHLYTYFVLFCIASS